MVVNGQKVKVQRRLILCNLKECYQRFKEQTGLKIGFSKFASLRPKNVILPDGSGTHSLCVCAIHQNVKLMLDGSRISTHPRFKELVGDDFFGNLTYNHLLARLLCNPAQPDCFFGRCESCPGPDGLKSDLASIFEELSIDEITYKSWISVDRTNLETIVKSADDFLDGLIQSLVQLQRHSFIAKQQALYLKHAKENLSEGEVVVIGDFAENYSFVMQDEVQGFHWTNTQATIHPFVAYHRASDGNAVSTVVPLSFVIISDCLIHDTVSVHHFQKKLFTFLNERFPVRKMIYFSDGAASQYKNRKNFSNLAHHEEDFGVPAEWHFFATSHGKGPCDGVGGTVKRLAARASLQRPYNDQIQTPVQLFNWAKENIQQVHFQYVEDKDLAVTRKALKKRFEECKAIEGTQKFHCFLSIPACKTKLLIKEYSFALEDKKVTVSHVSCKEVLAWEAINGYVTCEYDNHWWLALVLDLDMENDEVQLKFLHPAGPSSSFTFPQRDDILAMPRKSVLTTVSPLTVTGRTYTLSETETNEASKSLK